MLINTLVGQTLIQQIDAVYSSLDATAYIEDIILSYREDLAVCEQIMINHGGDLDVIISRPTYHHLASIERQNMIDSLMRNMSLRSKTRIEERTDDFISAVKDKPVHYVLNLMFEKHEQPDQHSFFQPDTSKLNFNLILFDKRFKPQFYVFVVWGKFVEYHRFFPTFSKRAAKNVPKIYQKILRKNPQYLLNCDNLEGGNTILYALNDEIFVYRILQMKEYKLDDYIKKSTNVSGRKTNMCGQEEILILTDSVMRKSGYKADVLDREITEEETFFLIRYLPKDPLTRGGGGEIKVSKETCEIIEKKFYQ
jgi:hypothetical protein